MYNRISDTHDDSSSMKFAKAVLQKDFVILNAEEALYSFLGKNSASFFNKLIHPDYEEEFLLACHGMKPGEKYSIITLMRDMNDEYRPVDIHINMSMPMENDDCFYTVDIYCIDMIETSFLTNQQKMDKYRMFMEISGLVYMEFWPETGRIVFYDYAVRKSHILYENNIEKWYKDVLQFAIDKGGNKAEIQKLYNRLKNLENQFLCTVKTGFMNEGHVPETLVINARYISRHNADVIVGIVNRKDITDDDIPYYLTKAGKDAATGLLNKRALIEYATDRLADACDNKLYMILIDIDDFKSINDTYGHLMGDKAIIVLAESLTEALDGRGVVGRFGGDEFFILTEDIPDEQQLRLFLKAMLSQLRYNQVKKLKSVRFTLSMGISQYPQAGNKFDDLFKLADKALYIAKDKGKNRYIIYRPQLHDSIDVIGRQNETGGYPVYIKALKDVVRNIIVNKCNDIKAILEEIKTAFSLGAAVVYSMTDYKAIVYTDGCPEGLLEVAFMGSDSYKALLAVDNVLVLNNLSSIEREDESIYTKLASTGCCSYISIQLPEAHMPEYIIAFYMLGMKHKWGNVEIDYLTILAEAVYSAFKNDKQK